MLSGLLASCTASLIFCCSVLPPSVARGGGLHLLLMVVNRGGQFAAEPHQQHGLGCARVGISVVEPQYQHTNFVAVAGQGQAQKMIGFA